MKKLISLGGLAGILVTVPLFSYDKAADQDKRFRESASVFTEIMQAGDKGIPEDLLERANCVAVVPGLKRVGFVLGGTYGKGVLTCRTPSGWSALSTIRIEGGSIGLQIGAGETDLVLVVMNDRGKEKLLQDKFTVGGDASVMAGPVGRSAKAATDAQLHAEILAYSRARGVFAGITLEGATLRPDNDDNRDVYGREIRQADIVNGSVHATPASEPLIHELDRYSPRERR